MALSVAWWHLAQVELIQHIVPGLGIRAVHQVGIEAVESDFPLFLFRPVALIAKGFQDRTDVAFKGSEQRWIRVRRRRDSAADE